jgi:hypothetical protein
LVEPDDRGGLEADDAVVGAGVAVATADSGTVIAGTDSLSFAGVMAVAASRVSTAEPFDVVTADPTPVAADVGLPALALSTTARDTADGLVGCEPSTS